MNATEEHAAAVIADLQSRFEAIQKLIATTPPPPDPHPQESDAALRRRIFRLRAGLIRPADPSVDRATLIDALKRELDYRVMVRLIVEELRVMRERLSADIDAKHAGLMEQALILFYHARHLPEAQDPNSELSEWIRRMERARKADSGRPRRK